MTTVFYWIIGFIGLAIIFIWSMYLAAKSLTNGFIFENLCYSVFEKMFEHHF